MGKSRYTSPEAFTRETFIALMNALAFPGRILPLPLSAEASTTSALAMIADTLLDLETTFFTPNDSLAEYLARTGAKPKTASDAAYHFYMSFNDQNLSYISKAKVGTMTYPDAGATLIIGIKINVGSILTLTGPGIQTKSHLTVDMVPDAFWEARRETLQYPLGWDVIFVDKRQIVGIPRTTIVEVK